MMKFGTLYLIPTPLAEGTLNDTIPSGTLEVVSALHFFVVEELRTSRRFLSTTGHKGNLDKISLFVLNEHTSPKELNILIQPLLEGNDMGLLSEAGLPAVADPGANLVALAHLKGIKVTPLTGPSSLMLALMASGLNGESFAFVGYLPIHSQERKRKIREFEKRAIQNHQTQLFIETPYRSLALFGDLLEVCAPQTLLCIAANLTAPSAFIATKSVAQWRLTPLPPIHKTPTVFGLNSPK